MHFVCAPYMYGLQPDQDSQKTLRGPVLGSSPLRDGGFFLAWGCRSHSFCRKAEEAGMPQTGKAAQSYILVLLGEVWSTPCLVRVFSLHHGYFRFRFFPLCGFFLFFFFFCFFGLYLTIFTSLHVLLLLVSFTCNGLIFPALYRHISAQNRELNFLRETSSNLKPSYFVFKMEFPFLMAISLLPPNPILKIIGNISQTGLKRNILVKCHLGFE